MYGENINKLYLCNIIRKLCEKVIHQTVDERSPLMVIS